MGVWLLTRCLVGVLVFWSGIEYHVCSCVVRIEPERGIAGYQAHKRLVRLEPNEGFHPSDT